MKHCPHKEEQDKVNMNVQITLLSSKPDLMQKSIVLESLGKGLLGTGCSKMVDGHTWLKEFLDKMLQDKVKIIKEVPSKFVFRFGDSAESTSLKKVILPIVIGQENMNIQGST